MITVNITEQVQQVSVEVVGVQQVSVEVLEADVAALKSQLDTYVDATSKPSLEAYVDAELKPAMDTHKDEMLQEISDHGTELTGFSGSVVIDGSTYEFENGILKQQL